MRAARRELTKVIRAVDAEIVEVFRAAFADVADNFEQLFATLFPGGQGRLRLTDPDHLLDTGIEVEARPSGKNVRRLSLLSGGERSLTAMAFLFAVFRSRPSPFYLMDEVEAALDDVNLHRFLDLVHEFRDEAQLLIVSHQKRTMEAADCLYGVTMAPGGSSRVVSEQVAARGTYAARAGRPRLPPPMLDLIIADRRRRSSWWSAGAPASSSPGGGAARPPSRPDRRSPPPPAPPPRGAPPDASSRRPAAPDTVEPEHRRAGRRGGCEPDAEVARARRRGASSPTSRWSSPKSRCSSGSPPAPGPPGPGPVSLRRLPHRRSGPGTRSTTATWDELEEALILADVGVELTTAILDDLRARVKAEADHRLPTSWSSALKADLVGRPRGRPRAAPRSPAPPTSGCSSASTASARPRRSASSACASVRAGTRCVMAAGDTFRAAAADQLACGPSASGAELVRGQEGGDPGRGRLRRRAARRRPQRRPGAGRHRRAAPHQVNLMEELKKVRRVADRPPGQVTEVLLVIDATTGQNGLIQAKQFADAVDVTGIVLTKLDGTAKGGIVLAIQAELGHPDQARRAGREAEDLVDFDPDEFVDALCRPRPESAGRGRVRVPDRLR